MNKKILTHLKAKKENNFEFFRKKLKLFVYVLIGVSY